MQQKLYAYMLASKYGLAVRKMMLVQCHPDACGPSFNEAPLTPDFALSGVDSQPQPCLLKTFSANALGAVRLGACMLEFTRIISL